MPLFGRKNSKRKTEDAWVIDSVVGFLASPVWFTPLQAFADRECLIFDAEEENKLEYTLIHHAYRDLVESLLESFLADVGLSAEQFAAVMIEAETSSTPRFSPEVFMLVSAADDFLLFRRLMFRRNLQLEREARSVAARIYGARLDHSAAQGRPTAPPQPSAKEKEALHGEAEEQRRRETEEEERLIEEVIRLSLEDYEAQKSLHPSHDPSSQDDDAALAEAIALSKREDAELARLAEREEAELAEALRESLKLAPTRASKPKPDSLPSLQQTTISQHSNPADASSTTSARPNALVPATELPPLPGGPVATPLDSVVPEGHAAPPMYLPSTATSGLVVVGADERALASEPLGSEELAARRKHLREQRARLLELRDKQREERLKAFLREKRLREGRVESGEGASSAPGARTAGNEGTPAASEKSSGGTTSAAGAAMRRALASRIRREVRMDKE